MAATILRSNPSRFITSSIRSFCTSPLPLDPRPASSTTTTTTTTILSIPRIKASIRNEPDPDRLTDLFSSVSTNSAIYGDRILYRHAIKKLSAARRPDLIHRVLDHQLTDPSTPKSEGFIMRIISLYGESSMPDKAAAAFDLIPPPRSDRALCALLTAFFNSGQRDRLQRAFDNAESTLSATPGIACRNLILKSLCENGEVAAARAMLDEMPQSGLEPDIISYNTVLGGYMNSKDSEGFEEVLKELSGKNLEGNVVTYNCRMAALCGAGRCFEAEELLDMMISKGVRPNTSSFNALIDGFCKEGSSASAMKVFRRMEKMKREDRRAATANRLTYMLLLGCLVEKEEFVTALEIADLCFARKWSPPFPVVKGLVHGLIKKSSEKEAKDVLKKMERVVKGDSIPAWQKIVTEFTF